MNWLGALLLGVVQGITEFLPVSSSGHLILFDRWLKLESTLAFDVILHAGTLLAIVIFYRKEIITLLLGAVRPGKQRAYALAVIIATIPAALAGYLFENTFDSLRTLPVITVTLAAVALLMLLAERVGSQEAKQPGKIQALLIGAAQIVALVPGTSRSGITISAGLFSGLTRQAATKFSFFMAMPIIGGALLKQLIDGDLGTIFSETPGVAIVGLLASLLSGFIAIRFLVSYVAKHSIAVFAYYRLALAALLIILGVVGV